MREIRSSGSVGERQGNEPLYPECCLFILLNFDVKIDFFENPKKYSRHKNLLKIKIQDAVLLKS
jgi:hypothetical protein